MRKTSLRKALPRRPFFFYRGTELTAVRYGPWKAHLVTQSGYGGDRPETHATPVLFHLGLDPSERFNVAGEHPDVVSELLGLAQRQRTSLVPGIPQLD